MGITIHVGDIINTLGCSVLWGDIMIHVGYTMSNVVGVQYRGGTQITKDDIPTVLNTLHY